MVSLETLEAYYETIEKDNRVGTVHISLYMALLFAGSKCGSNPFELERKEMMISAKINARSTFDICINELKEFGYIGYEPSKGAGIKSRVFLKKL
jgi:hypothetical protein